MADVRRRGRCLRCNRYTHLRKVRGFWMCTVCMEVLEQQLETRMNRTMLGRLNGYVRDQFRRLLGHEPQAGLQRFPRVWRDDAMPDYDERWDYDE